MLHKVIFNTLFLVFKTMSTFLIKPCKFCSKTQPELNLFCISCNKREWDLQ
jgi:hypothetical protein